MSDVEYPSHGFRASERAPLAFLRTRREFLLAGVRWLRVRANTSPGRPALGLSVLGTVSDEVLGSIAPKIRNDCAVEARSGVVWCRRPGSEAPIRLFEVTSPDICVFNAINGSTPLAEIARIVVDQAGCTYQEAFATSRAVVLRLVSLEVCIPSGPL